MSRGCSVCDHPQRQNIDMALVAGQTLSQLAAVHNLSTSALSRHRLQHVSALLKKAKAQESQADTTKAARHQKVMEAEETAHALDLRQQLKLINAASLEVLGKARAAAKPVTQLQAVDRIYRQITLQAQLLGQAADDENQTQAIQAQWPLIRQVILDALQPFPKAKIAVAEALRTLSDVAS